MWKGLKMVGNGWKRQKWGNMKKHFLRKIQMITGCPFRINKLSHHNQRNLVGLSLDCKLKSTEVSLSQFWFSGGMTKCPSLSLSLLQFRTTYTVYLSEASQLCFNWGEKKQNKNGLDINSDINIAQSTYQNQNTSLVLPVIPVNSILWSQSRLDLVLPHIFQSIYFSVFSFW